MGKYDGHPRKLSIIRDALPEDAQLVGCTFNPERMQVNLFIYSETFEPVAECDVVPEIRPIFKIITD